MIRTASDRGLGWLRRGAGRLTGSSRGVKRLLAAATDAVCCVLAVWLSFMVRLGVWVDVSKPFLIFVGFQLACALAVFFTRGVYNNLFRFHGPNGLAQIARCCLIIAVPSMIVFGFISLPGVPRTVSVIFPLVFFVLVAINRLVARYILVEMVEPQISNRRVLIYGAGTAGQQLASSMRHERGYQFVAYADDDPKVVGQKLEGFPIIGPAALEGFLKDNAIDLVLLAIPNLQRTRRVRIVERFRGLGVHVQTLPGIHEVVSGNVSVSDLREIEITDLLARDQVPAEPSLLATSIRDKVVLVTGAGGSIGSELCRQIVRQKPTRLVLFEMTEASLFAIDNEIRAIVASEGLDLEVVAELGSLVNSVAVNRLFERWRPHTVFHAAAYKHVPLVEANAVAGVRNNVLGTLHCALAASATAVERFILVSTDKAVRPPNVMGASKRVCELILQALSDKPEIETKFVMVRFGNVLGSSGSVVPQFQSQIAKGGPVTVTHRDVTRFFMTISEAASLVIQAGSMAQGGEVYLLDMGEPVRIYDLARSMISMSGRTLRDADNPDGDIEIIEIGLRPGEKLYEELLIDAEAMPTDHQQIFRAREEGIDWSVLSASLERMKKAIDAGDNMAIRHLLSGLVSGYRGTVAAPDMIEPEPDFAPASPPQA